jgi:hypothetical protein
MPATTNTALPTDRSGAAAPRARNVAWKASSASAGRGGGVAAGGPHGRPVAADELGERRLVPGRGEPAEEVGVGGGVRAGGVAEGQVEGGGGHHG